MLRPHLLPFAFRTSLVCKQWFLSPFVFVIIVAVSLRSTLMLEDCLNWVGAESEVGWILNLMFWLVNCFWCLNRCSLDHLVVSCVSTWKLFLSSVFGFFLDWYKQLSGGVWWSIYFFIGLLWIEKKNVFLGCFAFQLWFVSCCFSTYLNLLM